MAFVDAVAHVRREESGSVVAALMLDTEMHDGDWRVIVDRMVALTAIPQMACEMQQTRRILVELRTRWASRDHGRAKLMLWRSMEVWRWPGSRRLGTAWPSGLYDTTRRRPITRVGRLG